MAEKENSRPWASQIGLHPGPAAKDTISQLRLSSSSKRVDGGPRRHGLSARSVNGSTGTSATVAKPKLNNSFSEARPRPAREHLPDNTSGGGDAPAAGCASRYQGEPLRVRVENSRPRDISLSFWSVSASGKTPPRDASSCVRTKPNKPGTTCTEERQFHEKTGSSPGRRLNSECTMPSSSARKRPRAEALPGTITDPSAAERTSWPSPQRKRPGIEISPSPIADAAAGVPLAAGGGGSSSSESSANGRRAAAPFSTGIDHILKWKPAPGPRALAPATSSDWAKTKISSASSNGEEAEPPSRSSGRGDSSSLAGGAGSRSRGSLESKEGRLRDPAQTSVRAGGKTKDAGIGDANGQRAPPKQAGLPHATASQRVAAASLDALRVRVSSGRDGAGYDDDRSDDDSFDERMDFEHRRPKERAPVAGIRRRSAESTPGATATAAAATQPSAIASTDARATSPIGAGLSVTSSAASKSAPVKTFPSFALAPAETGTEAEAEDPSTAQREGTPGTDPLSRDDTDHSAGMEGSSGRKSREASEDVDDDGVEFARGLESGLAEDLSATIDRAAGGDFGRPLQPGGAAPVIASAKGTCKPGSPPSSEHTDTSDRASADSRNNAGNGSGSWGGMCAGTRGGAGLGKGHKGIFAHAPSSMVGSEVVVNGASYWKTAKIGRGGSSEVFRVVSTAGEMLALKVVRVDQRGGEHSQALLDSYSNEIALLRRLQGSRFIIDLHDAEVDRACGTISILLELGETDLDRLLQQHKVYAASKRAVAASPGESDLYPGGLEANFVRVVWQQMLKAVHAMHEQRVVHGDLKPANFVFVRGSLKLIDFGIAKAISNDTTNISRDSRLGTMNYMCPEAFEDTGKGAVDPATGKQTPVIKLGRASDIWSLGCILYQMAHGRTPFSHLDMLQKMRAITNRNHHIPIADLEDASLVETLRSCLQRDPSARTPIAGAGGLLSNAYLHPVANRAAIQQACAARMKERTAATEVELRRRYDARVAEEVRRRLELAVAKAVAEEQARQAAGLSIAKSAVKHIIGETVRVLHAERALDDLGGIDGVTAMVMGGATRARARHPVASTSRQ